ncbi:hypothetical protein SESBI_40618 [Sesbania bispinosa]|nr:hypothetical protein SESBI_40618 [Sesbania bispinosa]
MAEIPATNENPLTMEQRMERLEGSFSQILDLLKTVIPVKEVVNDNSNNDENGDGAYPPNFHNPYHAGTSQVGNSTPPQVNNVSFPNNPPTSQNPPYQPRKERIKIDPVPISYSELYDTLLKANLVAPEVPKPVSNPPPKLYNANERCKFHMGEVGHSIERCLSFKIRVQKLRDIRQVNFEVGGSKQASGTMVGNDPLPKH